MIGGSDQQECHKRQQAGHHRVKIELATQARADTDRDEEGHDPHAQVERQHQLRAVFGRKIQPGAGKAVGRFG